MNRKDKICRALWLQTLLEDEAEEEEEENGGSSSEEDENIIIKATLLQRLNTRYLKPRIYRVVKSKCWWQNVLPFYDPGRFKKLLRMHSNHFMQLADIIRSHPVFSVRGSKSQASVEFQLAVFLCRLGSNGSIFEHCSRYGVSEGTIILYTKRVIQAIMAKKKLFIKWSTLDERKKVHE
jgi:hypothetical protein